MPPVNLINRFYLAAVNLKPGYGETGLIVEGNSMYILQKLLVLSNITCPVVAVSVAAAIYMLPLFRNFYVFNQNGISIINPAVGCEVCGRDGIVVKPGRDNERAVCSGVVAAVKFCQSCVVGYVELS